MKKLAILAATLSVAIGVVIGLSLRSPEPKAMAKSAPTTVNSLQIKPTVFVGKRQGQEVSTKGTGTVVMRGRF